MKDYRFNFKPDVWMIVITVIASLVFVFIILYGLQYFLSKRTYFDLIICFIVLLILIICMLLSPLYIQANKNDVDLKRVIGGIKIRYDAIKDVRQIEKAYIKKSVRLFGAGGLGGYYGWYRNAILGDYYMFTTNRKCNLIYIELKSGKKYVTNCNKLVFDKIKANVV